MQKQSLKGTIWLCTRNNPKAGAKEYLENMYKLTNAKYVCGQLEKGMMENTPHIQFYISLANP